MRRTLLSLLAVAGLASMVVVGLSPAQAADHLEAPLVSRDGRTDINDLYAFQSPDDPDNVVLVMTVNPAAGALSPTTFDPRASYRFRIDNDDDARFEKTVQVRFGRPRGDGSQVVRVVGPNRERARGFTGETIELGNGGKLTATTFDDPFFFDLQAFRDQVGGAGGHRSFCDGDEVDFFAGLNVSAIVLEVPRDSLTKGTDDLGVWAETFIGARKVDRMGRPAISTVLIDSGSKDAFNRTVPAKDLQRFGDQITDNLLALSGLDGSGYTRDEADGITEILLPDILTVDTSMPGAYLNGRAPADDVIDLSLFVVTGGLGANGSAVLDSDCVDANDVPFPMSFPYLAPAH